MPHKHKRRKGDDTSAFDLPPTRIARALPVGKQAAASTKGKGKNNKGGAKPNTKPGSSKSDDSNAFLSKPITSYHDDTPRAFARMMAWQPKGKGSNASEVNSTSKQNSNSSNKNKKRKRGGDGDGDAGTTTAAKPTSTTTSTSTSKPTAPSAEMPTIKPGEKLSDFATRVDAALPVAGLKNKRSDPLRSMGVKQRQTKTEKRMQRMYAEWREEDKRIKERLEEEREEAEEREEEQRELYGLPVSQTIQQSVDGPGGKRKKNKKRQGGSGGGHANDDDDDPWAVLKQRDQKPKLNDVAQAPPTFTNIPKEKFRVKNGARVNVDNVPNAAGSLRRREELGEARQNVLEAYRKMMEQKRAV